jgi:hypothetical protein
VTCSADSPCSSEIMVATALHDPASWLSLEGAELLVRLSFVRKPCLGEAADAPLPILQVLNARAAGLKRQGCERRGVMRRRPGPRPRGGRGGGQPG